MAQMSCGPNICGRLRMVAAAAADNWGYVCDGSVSKVEMIPLHCPSKGIAVDKQANDEVVHLCGFREANGLTDQAFNARPQGQMRALDLLRILFAWAVDSGVEMTRVGTPIIRIIACDPKGFQQGF